MEMNDISNYFLECPDCGHECRLHDAAMSQYAMPPTSPTMSQCPRCLCRLNLMIDLHREQHDRLMRSVNNQLLTLTERDIMFKYILTGDLGLTECIIMPYEMPYAFIAQAFWAHLCHQPSTSEVNKAMKFCEETFAANVVNHVNDVDEKNRD
jgi:hypothetical protein